jgi:multiple sugar transport system permease protein
MNERRLNAALYYAGTALALGFFLAPVAYMAVVGLSRSPDFGAAAPRGIFTLENYRAIFSGGSLHFLDFLKNSLIVSAASSVVCVAVATPAAFAIARLPLPGKMGLLFAVLAVSMFPQICIVGYLFRFMSALGWINTYQGLVIPYIAWALPLSLWILVSYFSRIPKGLDRAAIVDGCTPWQVLCRILLPVAAPGVFSTLLLAFIFSFNEFMFALMLTTDFHARTVPVGIALFQGLHGEIPWGTIMAAATITTAPVVACTVLFQRSIVAGLTRGALKG